MSTTSKQWGALVSAVALLGCGSQPCETQTSQPNPTVLRGGETLSLNCTGEAPHQVFVANTVMVPQQDRGEDPHPGIFLYLFASSPVIGESSIDLDLFIPKDLEDGTYPVGHATDAIQVTRRLDPQAVVEGTIAFQRTRDVPLLDNLSPKPKVPFTSSVELTLDVHGTLHYTGYYDTCGTGTFSVGPVALHVERTAEIGTCENNWAPRLGH